MSVASQDDLVRITKQKRFKVEFEKSQQNEENEQTVRNVIKLLNDQDSELINLVYDKKVPHSSIEEKIDDYIAIGHIKTTLPVKELKKLVIDDLFGYGMLQPILDEPDVTDLFVNDHKTILKRVKGKDIKVNLSFKSSEHLEDFFRKLLSRLGAKADKSSPIVDTRDQERHLRINGAVPPVVKETYFTIRKHQSDTFNMRKLVEVGLVKQLLQRRWQGVGQRRNVGGACIDARTLRIAQCATALIGMAGQREQRRMPGMTRHELVPGAAAEAHGEQAVRRHVDAAQGAHEGGRVLLQLCVGHGGKTQLGAAAAGNGGEHARAGMAMERMPGAAYRERVQRRGIAVRQVHAAQPRRGFIQCVDEARMLRLAQARVAQQRIAGTDPELGDQRHLDRAAIAAGRQADAGKRTTHVGGVLHADLLVVGSLSSRGGFAAGTGAAFALQRAAHRTDLGGPREQGIGQRVGHLPEVHELAALLALDQPGVFQDAQVAGQRRLAEIEALAQLARAQLAAIEVGQDLPACGGGEGFEDAVHGG